MLNLSEDHLDRYAGLAAYAAAKARVFQGAGTQVLNRCDSASMALARTGATQLTFGLDAPRDAPRISASRERGGRHGSRAARSASWPWTSCPSRARTTRPTRWRPARWRSPRARRCAALAGGAAQLSRPAAPHAAGRAARRRRVAGRFQGHQRGRHGRGAERAARARRVLILGGEGKGQNFSPLAPAVRDAREARAADRARRAR